MTKTISATSDCGYGFDLQPRKKTPWDALEVSFRFQTPCMSGSFQLPCSVDRYADLTAFVVLREQSFAEGEYCFISSEGNLQVDIYPKSSGRFAVSVVAIPNMADDDRVEFSFEGSLRSSPVSE